MIEQRAPEIEVKEAKAGTTAVRPFGAKGFPKSECSSWNGSAIGPAGPAGPSNVTNYSGPPQSQYPSKIPTSTLLRHAKPISFLRCRRRRVGTRSSRRESRRSVDLEVRPRWNAVLLCWLGGQPAETDPSTNAYGVGCQRMWPDAADHASRSKEPFMRVLEREQTTLDNKVVPQEGFEPPTYALRMRRSTN